MNKCVMCGKAVNAYPGYVTDGKVFVCDECAASNSLIRVVTRIENVGLSANLKSVFSDAVVVEGSLVDQTSEPDARKSDANTSLVDQTSNKPQGYMPDCPFLPCDNCRFYYGEIDSCMVGEVGVVPDEEEIEKVRKALGEEAARDFFAPLKSEVIMHDIENMSQEDFYSKYADNPAALNDYHNMRGEPSEFLEY